MNVIKTTIYSILKVLAIVIGGFWQVRPKSRKMVGHIFPSPTIGSSLERFYLELAQYYLGVFEPDSLALVRKYIRGELSAIDVGSNIGIWVSFLAHVLRQNVTIHSIDPNPGAISYIQKFVKSNVMKNVHVTQIALSNKVGYSKLYLNKSTTADVYASLVPGRTSSYIRVETTTLDNYCDEQASDWTLGFLKVDVEGFELKVLEGGEQTIKRHMPDICLEVNFYTWAAQPDSIHSLERRLKTLGYRIFREKSTYKGLRLQEIVSISLLDHPVSNIHCFSNARVETLSPLILL